MILTGQLKYLMCGLWKVNELTSEHLICKQIGDEERYIEVKKENNNTHDGNGIDILFPYIITVSIPLTRGRYIQRFPSEMMAYEYLENFVMDPIDRLEESINHSIVKQYVRNKYNDIGFITKKRRLTM